MLDDLFNAILVFGFLALSAFGALNSQAQQVQPETRTIAQLERVIVTSPSVKAERGG